MPVPKILTTELELPISAPKRRPPNAAVVNDGNHGGKEEKDEEDVELAEVENNDDEGDDEGGDEGDDDEAKFDVSISYLLDGNKLSLISIFVTSMLNIPYFSFLAVLVL